MKKKVTYLFSVLLLLVCWQLTAIWINNSLLFPDLFQLIRSLGEMLLSGEFYYSVFITIGRGLTGIICSLVTAFLFSSIFAQHPVIYELFRPVLSIMRSVPVISFILLALIFINPDIIPLLIGFLTMFPILTENLTQGILHLNKGFSQMGHQFRIGRYNYITQIIYPQLKPFLDSGLATAAGFGWRAIIMGEVLAQSSSGIGGEMKRAQIFIAVPELLAWTAVAVIISFLADRGIASLSHWAPRVRYAKNNNKAVGSPVLSTPIVIDNISFGYDKTEVLKDLSLIIASQSITGLSAPSGRGKTTLLSLLNSTLFPLKGKIEIEKDIPVSNLFQEPFLLSHLSVLENITLPLAAKEDKEKAMSIVLPLLKELGIEELADRLPPALSYGQQQRVALARALAYPAPLILMDEPFKGLDKEMICHIIKQIKRCKQQTGQTIIFTSHQPEELEELADKIIKI